MLFLCLKIANSVGVQRGKWWEWGEIWGPYECKCQIFDDYKFSVIITDFNNVILFVKWKQLSEILFSLKGSLVSISQNIPYIRKSEELSLICDYDKDATSHLTTTWQFHNCLTEIFFQKMCFPFRICSLNIWWLPTLKKSE